MSDIFICYSRKDIAIATQLVQRFQQEGWNVFIDKQTYVGRRWHKEIERELHAARAVVVLWSASSRDSDYVLEEAEYGKRKNILFPAFIEHVEFPYGFSRIQTVDLSNWNGNPEHSDWLALLQSLRLHLTVQEQNSTIAEPVEQVKPSVNSSSASVPIHASRDPESGKRGSEASTIKKFLFSAALVVLGIIIFPVAKSLLEEFMQPEVKKQQKQHSLDPALIPEFVPIPAGSFMLGEQDKTFIKELKGPDKEYFGIPGKQIRITKPFYLGKTEVTYAQYDYYIQQQQQKGIPLEYPKTATGGHGNQPIVNVNWREAITYAQWLSEQTNNRCRLPTEAEWEYAARAGTQTAYPWGDDLGHNNANCNGCGSPWDNKESAPAGSFAANEFGLYDMSGNVWEWTCSNWGDRFSDSAQQCNDSMTDVQIRVGRGGSWGSHPNLVRSSARNNAHPGYRFDDIGFRVLCSSPIE
jgi:formylglycine-generating enzyme required for sulfatase activity